MSLWIAGILLSNASMGHAGAKYVKWLSVKPYGAGGTMDNCKVMMHLKSCKV